ncbi:hypothetical protein ACFSM5_11225 [Lacibacterium aquatile]|uniref:Uncharacterized protein n=1 Tax=Lacibacterium aquatile TaxID=1168082 RepID=A0ABW5DU16_9PROT
MFDPLKTVWWLTGEAKSEANGGFVLSIVQIMFVTRTRKNAPAIGIM